MNNILKNNTILRESEIVENGEMRKLDIVIKDHDTVRSWCNRPVRKQQFSKKKLTMKNVINTKD